MKINIKNVLSGMFVLMLVFLAGYFGSGCGKSTTEPTPTPAAQKTISFTPSNSPSDNSVYLEKVSANNDEIILAVKVKGGADVYGTAIEINFDGSKISYVSAAEGSYLNQGTAGATIFPAGLEQGSTGMLLIGINKKGDIIGVTGDGILCQIVLKVLTAQTSTTVGLNSTNSSLKSPAGNITGTSWLGGGLSYQ